MFQPVKTIYGSYLEQVRDKGGVWAPMVYSTLNEHYDVHPDEPLPQGSYPTESYIMVGRGAHRGSLDSNNLFVVDVADHKPTDADMFDAMPFIVRPIDADLTAVQRTQYGLRKLISVSGVDYFAYYLKRIAATDQTDTVIEVNTIVDNIVSSVEYVPTPAQLDPVPVILANDVATATTGTSISVKTVTSIPVDAATVQELINSATILFGDTRYASISEIAVVTSYILPVTSTAGNVNVTYDEAIGAQVSVFIPSNTTLPLSLDGFDIQYSMGTEVFYNP